MRYDDFFRFARKRQDVYEKRQEGYPRPWSDDDILNNWYFTNVYRENDKTTEWFRENVRRDLQLQPEVIPATMLFRWFNRINIGETIFCQPDFENTTIFDRYIKDRNIGNMKAAIKATHPKGPYVNGAYIIKAFNGMDKLSGVLRAFHESLDTLDDQQGGYTGLAEMMLEQPSMERATKALARINYLGMFMAYEIVCDLRYTIYLSEAPDKMTWANPGPGAKRGLNRILNRDLRTSITTGQANAHMRDLLSKSHDYGWEDWEMREVEHTLCEFDKYERIREGGRGKRRY